MAASRSATKSTRALPSAAQLVARGRAISARQPKRTSKRKRAKNLALELKGSGGLRVLETKVSLPHIAYMVHFRRMIALPPHLSPAGAYIKRLDRNSCAIYLPEYVMPGYLVHEITHAVQFICQDRNMAVEEEFEHLAYIAQYLTGRALGHVWDINET